MAFFLPTCSFYCQSKYLSAPEYSSFFALDAAPDDLDYTATLSVKPRNRLSIASGIPLARIECAHLQYPLIEEL